MNTNFFTKSYLRTLANSLAAKSNRYFLKAKENNAFKLYYADKVNILRNFLLNSPWVLFSILYFLILIIDAVLMKPIIEVVVVHGFKFDNDLMLILFVAIYILLVAGLTIGVAWGFSKLFDEDLRDLQVELKTISKPGVTRSIIEDKVINSEQRERKLGITFAVMLFAILISLSLYRNYITNDFSIKFSNPNDWINLLLPIALGLGLCFFGLYKDVLVKLLRFKYKRKYYSDLKEKNQNQADRFAQQAIEQNNEAIKNGENIPYSAELKSVMERYEKKSFVESNFYDEMKSIIVRLIYKGQPVPNIQISAKTGDHVSLFTTTDDSGTATIEWATDADFISDLNIGPYKVNGTMWLSGSKISFDMEDFIHLQQPKLNGSTNKLYLENLLLKSNDKGNNTNK